MVKISAIQKNHLPVVKIGFTTPESDLKNNTYEKFFFLHHCFKAFEALPKVVLRMFLSFRSKSSKAAKLFLEIGFLGIFMENTCDGGCY